MDTLGSQRSPNDMEFRFFLSLRHDPMGVTIYLIGSLRNPKIVESANVLREAGYDVFEDWHAGGSQADDEWQRYERERGRNYRDALTGYHAVHIFNQDIFHLNRAHGVVLVLPAGRSGHLEFGHEVGKGKPGFVLAEDQIEPDRYDVMTQFATAICHSKEELLHAMKIYPWRIVAKIPNIHAVDALWLAGLLEGEGSFVCDIVRGEFKRPRIALQMTDKDIVQKVAKLLGAHCWGPYSKMAPRKDVWATAITGPRAAEWMRILHPYFGARRQAKINEILNSWTPRIPYSRLKKEEQQRAINLRPWNNDR